MVFDVLQLAPELLELDALGVIPDGHVRFEGGLVVEELVFVDLVGADGRLDVAFQLHPRDVAVVVVVGEERIGPGCQEPFERRLRRETRGLPEKRRNLRQLVLILDTVGNEHEAAGRRAADNGEEPGCAAPLGVGQRLDPLLEIGLGGVRRIEVGAERLRRCAGNEGLVGIEARPGPFVEQKVVQARAALGSVVANEVQEHRLVAEPDLPQEQRVHQLRRLHQLAQHLAIGNRQCREIRSKIGRSKARGLLLELGGHRRGRGRSGSGHRRLLWRARCEAQCHQHGAARGRDGRVVCHHEALLASLQPEATVKRVTAPLPLIAVLVAAASVVALIAQQPAAPAAPQRGGGGLGAQPPPGGTAPQLEALKMPKGFSVAIWADKVAGARSMTLGADGTVYVGTQRGDVYAVADRNRDNKADDVLTVASGLTQPNGVAFRDGSLYVAEISKISRYDGVEAFVKAGAGAPAPKPVVVYDQFPTDRQHGWKYLAFGPDGLLYTQVGAPGNIVERPDPYATILRMKPDGSGLEIFARGVRNSVGLAWHPDTTRAVVHRQRT